MIIFISVTLQSRQVCCSAWSRYHNNFGVTRRYDVAAIHGGKGKTRRLARTASYLLDARHRMCHSRAVASSEIRPALTQIIQWMQDTSRQQYHDAYSKSSAMK